MDLGFATHAVHMDQRYLKLVSTLSTDKKTLTVTGPPTARLYPPGPGFLYVVTDAGVPSFGHKTIIGTGTSPPVDQGAIAKFGFILYIAYLLTLFCSLLHSASSASLAPNIVPTPTAGEGSDVATAVIPAPSD